jgi:hypothetical protein
MITKAPPTAVSVLWGVGSWKTIFRTQLTDDNWPRRVFAKGQFTQSVMEKFIEKSIPARQMSDS